MIIEHNHFLNANGPGDSAGCHIDFNCNNVVVQYNFSANNAGGFCEILGNNYHCAYRYNISVNDGHRVKGKNGAFQEGKIFWLSGYQGNKNPRTNNFREIKDRGTVIDPLSEDEIGLFNGLKVTQDILGTPIVGQPDIGAIELAQ